ncbi:MAG: hypothetical protein QM765_51990 [Myxococcales bacterium]
MPSPAVTSAVRTPLRTRLLTAFTVAILIPSVVLALVATWTIRHQVRAEAQARVDSDLEAAKEIYAHNLERILDAMRIHAARPLALAVLADPDPDSHLEVLEQIRKTENLDVLTALDADGKVVLRAHNPGRSGDLLANPVAQRALASRSPQAAAAVVPASVLALDGESLARRASVELEADADGPAFRAHAPGLGADAGGRRPRHRHRRPGRRRALGRHPAQRRPPAGRPGPRHRLPGRGQPGRGDDLPGRRAHRDQRHR